MNLQTSYSTVNPSFGLMTSAPGQSAMDSVVLRHLRTCKEIESVLHLRSEIDLSVHHSAGSDFAALEKKETNSALSLLSSCTGK
jgi:hypothetical protein